MRKVNVKLTVNLVIDAEEGIDISEVVDEMEYGFTSQTEGAEISDSTIEEMEVTDSR